MFLVDVSDIFYFFSARGGGRGSPRRRPGGGDGGSFFIEKPRRGGLQDGRGREAGRVSAANWEFWGGGGAKYFFSRPKCPPSVTIQYSTGVCTGLQARLTNLPSPCQ